MNQNTTPETPATSTDRPVVGATGCSPVTVDLELWRRICSVLTRVRVEGLRGADMNKRRLAQLAGEADAIKLELERAAAWVQSCGVLDENNDYCTRAANHPGKHSGVDVVIGSPGTPSNYYVERHTHYTLHKVRSHGASAVTLGSFASESAAREAYARFAGGGR